METIKFKTNLKCNGCISAITPAMNSIKGIIRWNVDLTTPDRLLIVECEDDVSADVLAAINKAGYKIEKVAQP